MDLFAQRHTFQFHTGDSTRQQHVALFTEPRVEVSLILEGAITFVADGERRHVEAPAVTFQAYRHRLEVFVPDNQRTRTAWCNFSGDTLEDAEWEALKATPPILVAAGHLAPLFEHALVLIETDADGMATDPAYAGHARDALGAAIFAQYLRCAQSHSRPTNIPPGILAVKKTLDEAYDQAWTLERLAKVGGLNANYLITAFRRHLGVTPIRYLWNRRLDAGVHLLRTTPLSIENIAFRCGFQTAAHFSRMMKQRRLHAPSQLRGAREAHPV